MGDDESDRAGGDAISAPPNEVLSFLLKHAPVRIFEVDAQGVFVMNDGVNPPGGSGPGTLKGISAIAAYHDFPEGLAALQSALAGHESWVRYTREGRTYDLTLAPRRDEHGQVKSVLGMAQVVTERVLAEQEARKNEERFRRVFESNMIGLMFFRLTGEVFEANETVLRTLGYTAAEVESGAFDWRTSSAPGQEAIDERARLELLNNGVCTPFEKDLLRKDGTRVPVLLGAAMLN
ncbi:MAG: PAS domain-containing protein, partial [Polyangiaceae bacterium]